MGRCFLQSAVFIFSTIGAVEVMVAEQEFESGVSEPFDLGCIEMHHHAVADRLSAGGDGVASAFYFHEAKSTGSKRGDGFSYGA